MRWSTQDVARLAKISSRTLRHYDHIGLLRPSGTGAGGTRFYDRDRLLRLQHIRLLRELGLALPDIARVLDGETDEVAALRRHHARLLSDADRLRELADTVARTIEEKEGGETVPTEEIFHGFADDPYAAEARQRWGDAARESQERAAAWSPQEQQDFLDELNRVHERLAAALRADLPVDAPETQAAVADHYAWLSRSWTPDQACYINLGRMYVDDERFTANIDRAQPGLARYLRDAIEVWAPTHLE